MPDRNGKFQFNSYHKHDFIIKNDSNETIYNQVILTCFNVRSQIIKANPSTQDIKIDFKNNSASITINQFPKNQFFNIDFFVANGNIKDIININSEKSDIVIKRSKKMTIKRKISKRWNLINSSKIKNFFNNQYTIGIIVTVFGTIIVAFILAYFFNNFSEIDKNEPGKDTLKTNKNNNMETHNSNVKDSFLIGWSIKKLIKAKH